MDGMVLADGVRDGDGIFTGVATGMLARAHIAVAAADIDRLGDYPLALKGAGLHHAA